MEYFLRGCTKEYQLKNIIVANYKATQTFRISVDDDIKEVSMEMVSKEGLYWYPLCALTTDLSDI